MITIKKIPRKATTSSILILFSPLILMSGSDGDDSRIRSSDNTILLDSDYPFDYSRGRILQDSLQADVPIPNYAKVILVIGLATLSALLSGLTLGLMSLDSTQLEILMNNRAIDAKSAAYAKNIYPVRANNKGNLLLCTLIWAMVGANVLLSILLSSILSPLAGFLVSTFVLVVGTEILPLAVCNRYALVIGGYSAPIVRILMIMFLPIAYPLAAILDRILGKELGTIYSKTEFQHLLNIHTNRGIPGYSKDTTAAMTGALLYQDYTVQQIMTPIQNVYMLSSDVKLNYDNILQIFKAGYSRIPIYQGDNKNDILGLLLTKDLIFLDPSDNISIEAFISIFGRGLHVVSPNDLLGDILRELKQGRSHMALVRDIIDEQYYEIKGILTLEDILEVILGDEIYDETDTSRSIGLDWEKLQSLDVVRNNPKKKTLQLSERKAVVAYLRAHYYTDIVSFLSDRTLEWLIATTEVREFHTGVSSATTTNSMSNNIVHRSYKEGPMLRSSTTIYQEGIPSNICTLVLSGSLSIIVGKDDQFQTDMGPWSLLSLQALQDTDYTPDFTAFVPSSNTAMSSTRLLCIDRETFQAAKAAAAEEDDVQRKKEAKSSSSAKSDTTTTTSGYHDRTQLRSNLLAAFHQALIGNAAVTNGSNNGNNSNYT